MKRFRFSIASLLGLVLFAAVAVAALRAGSDLWDSIVLTLMLGALLIAVLLCVHRAEKRRAFWLGFGLFGWAYLLASFIPQVESRLLTTRALAYLDSQVARAPAPILATFNIFGSGSGNQVSSVTATFSPAATAPSPTQRQGVLLMDMMTGKFLPATGGTSENFVRIGHLLIAFMLAVLGGQVSRFLYVRSHQAGHGDKLPTATVSGS
jgi:hypothetical protein